MTPEERELIMHFCKRIQEEKDPITFNKLVFQLNEVFERKHRRIPPEHRYTPTPEAIQ